MVLDITKIKSYIISLHDATDRRNSMTKLMENNGVEDWSFFDAVDVRDKLPYWLGVGMSHREVLVTAKYPCIVYEDDIAPTQWFRKEIKIPKTGIVYLGNSVWGMRSGQSEVNGVTFEPKDDEYCRVKHMVSAHAIYYPNRVLAMKFSDGIIKHMFETLRPFDELYAKMQTIYETYCLKQPLFYQRCDRNETYTNFEVNK